MWTCPIITRFFFFFFFFFSVSLVLLPTTHAVFNITKILKRYPQFDMYNENLSQTGLAKFVNGQKSATVLVIANDQLRPFAQMQQYEVKKILTFHLMFGYYDASRLKGFASRTTLPTFYQGAAALTSNYEGNGIVTFRSSGESTDSKGVQLLATIEAQQDISVLQIASIVPMIAPTPPRPQQLPPSASPVASPPRKLLAPATAQAPSTQQTKSPSPPLAPPPSPTVTPSPPPPTPSTKTTPSTAPPPPQTPSTKTAPSTPSPPPPTPSSSNKTTPSNNAQSSPPPSPPSTPSPSANKTKTSTNAPPPSDATKPSVTAPSEAPVETNSTTPTPPAASPPTEAQAPDSSSDESNAPTPVVSPPKPSSETPAPATAADAPASGSTPAPAPEKSAARERVSSGNHLSSILVIFTAASFLFSVI